MSHDPSISLRSLLTLAWPIVVSRSTQVVIGLGDALMVAHLGEVGLAATSAGAFNTIAVLIFFFGISFIVSSFAAQLHGAGDAAGARRYGWYGLGLAGMAQLACLAAIPFVGPVLGLLPYEPAVQALVTEYVAFRLVSGGAAVGIEALSNYYGGLGNTRLPMVVNLAAMVLDLVGNWMLIGGHWGAPAWGVAGAAISSSIATTLVFLGFLGVFLLEGRRADGAWWPPGLSGRELGRMFVFGLPSGLNWFFEFFAFNVFINVVVAGLGTTALAAFMAVLNVNSVAFMPAFALASAGSILVGQAIGAGRKDDVPRAVWLTFGVAAAWQVWVGAVYLAFPVPLLRAFADEDAVAAGFLVLGARMLRLSTAWQLFDALATTLAECLRAAGDTQFTMWARIVIAWALFTPGAWYSVRVLGGDDVVAVAWVVGYLALLAAVLYGRFRGGKWREIELVEGMERAG